MVKLQNWIGTKKSK